MKQFFGFQPKVIIKIEATKTNFCLIRPNRPGSHSLGVFLVFLCQLFLRSCFCQATVQHSINQGFMAATANFLEPSTIFTQALWSSARATIGFLVTSLTKILFPPNAQPALSHGPSKSFRRMEASVLLGTLSAADFFFFCILLRSGPEFNPVSELWRQSSDPMVD